MYITKLTKQQIAKTFQRLCLIAQEQQKELEKLFGEAEEYLCFEVQCCSMTEVGSTMLCIPITVFRPEFIEKISKKLEES